MTVLTILYRKPLDRLVSYYYFLRYGDDVLKDKASNQKNYTKFKKKRNVDMPGCLKVRSRQGDQTTFDECVEKSQPDCDPKVIFCVCCTVIVLN